MAKRTGTWRAGLALSFGALILALLALGARQESVIAADADDEGLPLEWTWLETRGLAWDEVEVPSAVPTSASLARLVELGRRSYRELCASCHGDQGQGDGALAPFLATPPRNFVKERMRLRSVKSDGRAAYSDLYRTITAGVRASAMPSFEHLPPLTRWALVARVAELSPFLTAYDEGSPLPASPLRVRDGASVERGRAVYKRLQCGKCHGPSGRGDGIAAADQKDDLGRAIRVPDLTRGFASFKSGGSAAGIARVILTGLPGTPMPSAAAMLGPLEDEANQARLSDLAHYIRSLAAAGEDARREAWVGFFRGQRRWSPIAGERPEQASRRWDAGRSKRYALSETAGCTSCHDGIAPIATGSMALAIKAFAGGDEDRSCVVCHEGDAGAASKALAHRAMVANPGSLWVTGVGLGCAKCHSDPGALTSLHARALPEAVGGALMASVSRRSDPSGASGGNHVYRMQRGLMALEMGKATHVLRSAGLLKPGEFKFANFAVDDPDGPDPHAGSLLYKAFIARAKKKGAIRQMARTLALPSFQEAQVIRGPEQPAAAAYVDYYRKDCGRCHLWGEGRGDEGEHRSAGCSACHILTNDKGLYEGEDKTIPPSLPTHMKRHELVFAPPVQQCNHCHTRGHFTEKNEVHVVAGMICADCHTSIDVHGDGNIYPTIPFQLEVRCADCHGTADKRPWELPVGYGNGVTLEGTRGTYQAGVKQHLLTSRGNPRINWERLGEHVVVSSIDGDKEWLVPQVKDRKKEDRPAAPAGGWPKFRDPAAAHSSAHDAALECYACHNSKAPRCFSCHISYYEEGSGIDWVQTGLRFDPVSGRQTLTRTPGEFATRQRYLANTIWRPGAMRESRRGRLAPYVEGCFVTFNYFSRGNVVRQNLDNLTNPGRPGYPTGLGPTMAHEYEKPIRACAACHDDPNGAEPGKK